MSRYFVNVSPRPKPVIDKSLAVLFEPSVVSPLYSEDVMFDDGTVGKYRHDDVYLLFNQQRLNALGSDTANSWLSSLSTPSNSPLHELLDKCTDEQKLSLIKSRHIQSASELQAWDNFLTSVSDVTVGNIRNYVDSLRSSDTDSLDTLSSSDSKPASNSQNSPNS